MSFHRYMGGGGGGGERERERENCLARVGQRKVCNQLLPPPPPARVRSSPFTCRSLPARPMKLRSGRPDSWQWSMIVSAQ